MFLAEFNPKWLICRKTHPSIMNYIRGGFNIGSWDVGFLGLKNVGCGILEPKNVRCGIFGAKIYGMWDF